MTGVLIFTPSSSDSSRSASPLPPASRHYTDPVTGQRKEKAVVWLDIDNTLYPNNTGIENLMKMRIREYFHTLGFNPEEAQDLHVRYYTEYGLALRGLIKHHNIDALNYDQACDATLPLEDLLGPDPSVRQLLMDFDRRRCRIWCLTNAYRDHALRVLKILQLDDLVEGIVYADYSKEGFACKPEPEMFEGAMALAQTTDRSLQYFIDDSGINIAAAKSLGWRSCIHFVEPHHPPKTHASVQSPNEVAGVAGAGGVGVGDATIDCLEKLREVWKELFLLKGTGMGKEEPEEEE